MEPSENMLLGGLIVGGVLVSVVAIVGGFLHSRREVLLKHAERMKAVELGRDLPEVEKARIGAARSSERGEATPKEGKAFAAQCYSTTGAVCGTGFVFAWLAASNPGVAYAIAAATGAIGVTGMICGTVLASKAAVEPGYSSFAPKPPRFDPEAV